MIRRKKVKRAFIKVIAVKLLQPFFKKMHWLALRGMNYGNADTPKSSGEKYLLQYIVKNKSSNIIIFDVGANKGQYALFADTLIENKLIYSFEPTKGAFEKLSKIVAHSKHIKTYPFGLGSEFKTMPIYYNDSASVLSTVVGKEGFTHQETINIETLDNFCQSENIHHIDLLKIDVEGYEFDVLLGCKQMLTNGKIDYIQFEFGNRQVQSRHFLRDFIDLLKDYTIYRLIQNGFVKISKNPINEIFQTTNYVAIRKK